MVSGSRIEGGSGQVLSAGIRKTIQSIKEIVGNHSDADIYAALKETNMDPNETAQKLLNQDPFHEVKRKRDKKKENLGHKIPVALEPKRIPEVSSRPMKLNSYADRNSRRGGYTRNTVPDAGGSREFRVVRDNRVGQSASAELKAEEKSTSTSEQEISNASVISISTSSPGNQNPPVAHHSPQALNGLSDPESSQHKDVTLGGNQRKDVPGEKKVPSSTGTQTQIKVTDSQPRSTAASNSSVAGVYSSSSDPVHVPSVNSRPAANVGAIKREVGVVGPRRRNSENSARPSSSQGASFPNSQSGRDGHSKESVRSFHAISKSDQLDQTVSHESATAVVSVSRSSSNNQYGFKPHQFTGHQKAPLPNKEWKPKSSQKPAANSSPGVIGSPSKASTENSEDLKKDAAQVQDSISQMSISENQNVIIAAHIRVSETDRSRLTFGSLGTEFESSTNSVLQPVESGEESHIEPSQSMSVMAPESLSGEPEGGKQLVVMVDRVHSESNSPPSAATTDHNLTEKKESSPQHVDNYTDVRLVVRDHSPSYTPESLQYHDPSEMPSFSGYDPQMGYDAQFFRPLADESVAEPGLPSPQEMLSSHTANSIPTSSIAMVQQQQQQQQQQLAQIYPRLHVSPYANLMPYRQFLSPVYVPPIPVPGYSNNPAYPHPSNGNSYLLMPGNSSHLTANGVKYGVQQFKPVPTGNPTGFGNFTSPAGYAINTPGVVGSATGHEDSSRLKYKDNNLYVPNPQAETPEIWMNPRDLTSLPSATYYNMPGQTPTVYLPSHSGHASFNAAAAAQSSHMQFQGMYHTPPQPAAIASPHHLGPTIGGNIGVGMAPAAPGAQVGAYQQPQLGHLSWTGNY